MNGIYRNFLALVVIAILSACGSHIISPLTQENLDKVQPDMSAKDVKAILGEPNESKDEPIPIVGGTKTTYVYTDSNNDRIVIVLKNDNVQTKEGHFGTTQ